MRLAQRLPVAGVPEQVIVSLMGSNVIDDGRIDHPALLLALDAERMREQECFPRLRPSAVIATACGCSTFDIDLFPLLLLVLLASAAAG